MVLPCHLHPMATVSRLESVVLGLPSNGSAPGAVPPYMQLGTRCAHPPPPFSGSLTHSVSLCFLTVACKPKNVLTSEGRLLKCLLNVFSLCCLFLFRSLSLLHSCSLMCKHVSEPTLRSLLYCLITQIVFANSARQVDGSMLLSQAVY